MSLYRPVFILAAFLFAFSFFCQRAFAGDTLETGVTAKKAERTAKITWFGHSMFLVEFDCAKILFDPYSDIGYPLPPRPIPCDICVVSHGHADHSNLNIVGGAYALKNSEGSSNACGVGFDLIKSFHDRKLGADRGVNLVSVFEYDGVRFAHLGDLGAYDDALVARIGRVDVLMIPVGGYYTIDAYDAWELVRRLGPKIVIPMHYKTERLDPKIPIDTADKFLSGRSNVEYFDGGSCEIKLDGLPKEEKIYIFRI